MVVGSAAMAAASPISGLPHAWPTTTEDKHQVAVSHDTDGDLLTDREETALGYYAFDADQNRNGVADGTELAQQCVAVMDSLPAHIELWKAETFGLERCDVCGEVVNMGLVGVTNHRLGAEVSMPIIALHYLEHGAFSYAGDIHSGRLDIGRLAWALEIRFPSGPERPRIAA